MGKLPLEGIRVVESGNAWTAPFITQTLGDLGAEVIKVETILRWSGVWRGDPNVKEETIKGALPFAFGGYVERKPGKRPWNRIAIYNMGFRNKLGMTVDLGKPKGKEIFRRLIKVSDVFVENNSTGVMERLGLDYENLIKIKPDLIMVRTQGLGLTGPRRSWRTHGHQVDSLVGGMMLRGYFDVHFMMNASIYLGDYITPMHCTFAILAALHHRKKTGKGQQIEAAATENSFPTVAEAFMDYVMNGRQQETRENRDPLAAPQGCYRCKGEDRWVNVSITSDEEWMAFCKTIGNPAWTQEERFATSWGRWQNQDDLDKLIESWTSQHDHYAVMHLLQKAGVPAGPVLDPRDVYNDPHFNDRAFFEQCYQEDCGTHLYPGMIWKFSKTPLRIHKPPVRLGEHNEYVYKEVLGASDEEYQELEREGHIGMDYAPQATVQK